MTGPLPFTDMLTRARARDRSMEAERQSSISGSQTSSLADSAPQEEYIPKKRQTRKKTAVPRTQWVCVIPEELANCGGSTVANELSFVSLRDPRTESLRKFLLGAGEGEICEVLQFSDEPRSWFIDNSIQTDGSLQVCSPIDPLFLALPYFIKAAKGGKFTTLDAILEDAECDSYTVLERRVPQQQFKHICDLKELPSIVVYRYSKERTISWLQKKVEILADALEARRVYVGAGSHSALLVKSTKNNEIKKDDYLKFAFGIVSDYLPASVSELLGKLYMFTKVARKLEGENDGVSEEPPVKKHRGSGGEDGGRSLPCSSGQPLEDYTKFNSASDQSTTKIGKLTSSQKALAQVDKSGMKSLTSFFSGANKKTKKS